MKEAILAVLLAIMLVAVSQGGEATGVNLLDISFVSNGSSGDMTLHGTIVYPAGAAPAEGFLPAIIIGGSGPGNRWENTTASYLSTQLFGEQEAVLFPNFHLCYYRSVAVSPYYDIAVHLASSASMAVLVWDKRSCLKGQAPLCQNVPCLTPRATNCLNAKRLLNSDFIADSINALNYLLYQQSSVPVNRQRAAVIGHSAGCVQAPIVAAAFPQVVQQTVLLAGPAILFSTTLLRQYGYAVVQDTAVVEGALCNSSDPGQAQLLANLNKSIPVLQARIDSIQTQTRLINSGYYGTSDPFQLVDVGGITAPLLFWQQAYNLTAFATVMATINSYLAATPGATLLAINSEEDQQVSPYEFYPLRTILATSPSANRTLHLMFPYHTHFMNHASNTEGRVTESILFALATYFKHPSLVDSADSLRAFPQQVKPAAPGQPSKSSFISFSVPPTRATFFNSLPSSD